MVQRYLFFGSKKKYGTIKIECRIGYFSDWVVCGARVRWLFVRHKQWRGWSWRGAGAFIRYSCTGNSRCLSRLAMRDSMVSLLP